MKLPQGYAQLAPRDVVIVQRLSHRLLLLPQALLQSLQQQQVTLVATDNLILPFVHNLLLIAKLRELSFGALSSVIHVPAL